MNKERRKAIEEISSKLEDLKEQLESVAAEEQEYYDNMPESLQNGEKGDAAQQAYDNLESAVSGVAEAVDYLDQAVQR